jgi:putative methyltransferase (TIGR04325 family)
MAPPAGKIFSFMNRTLSNLIRPLVPARVLAAWRRRFGWQWFRGDFANWAAARAASAGYDDAAVLARVQAAVRAVKSGQAAWERDGTVFLEPRVNLPLLGALQAAAEPGAPLAVIDFGGSLGSTWWQHRHALADRTVRWHVVEQPHYVAAGSEFADAQLSFHDSIAGALAAGGASVILLSGVLPYVESPFALLDEIAGGGFRHVIIDRTPLVRSGGTKLVVQHTPPDLGGGSYPCWLFARAQLLACLEKSHVLVQEWPALDDLSPDVTHGGFHFRRKDA